jgi:hypothetical protein
MQQSARALELVGQINTHLATARFAQRGVILYSMAQDAPEAELQRLRFQKEAEGIRAALQQIRSLLDPARARSVDEFEAAFRSYTELAQDIVVYAVAGQSASAMETLKTKSKPIGATMEKIATELAEYERVQLRHSSDQVAAAVLRGKMIDLGLLFFAVGIGTIVLFIVRKVSSVLRTTARGIVEVSEQIHGEAAQISNGGASLASGASEQAAALQETSASSHEVSAMTAKGAENSRAAARSVADCDEKMNQAVQSLEQMVASMNQLDASSGKISN